MLQSPARAELLWFATNSPHLDFSLALARIKHNSAAASATKSRRVSK